jgi:hypothetical protein
MPNELAVVGGAQRGFALPRVLLIAWLSAALIVGLGVTPLYGWGRDGHRVVAKIAAKNLNPAARQKLAAILQTNDAGLEAAMAAAATWPDEIDKKSTGTADWHFIDVPVTAPFSLAGLCPQNNCVIARITEMSMLLGSNQTNLQLAATPNPAFSPTREELNFLIHFVGDIHQPLHAATDGDRGGNCVRLSPPLGRGRGATTELHAVWDDNEVFAVFSALAGQKAAGVSDEDNTATILFQRFKTSTASRGGRAAPAAWETSTVEAWAQESNDLARTDVYQRLHLPSHTAPANQCAPGIAPVAVDQAYLNSNVADVEQQLMRAGIRLSDILNRICAGNGCIDPSVGRRN